MEKKKEKPSVLIPQNTLLGVISWGINRPGIFLRLCQIFRDSKLDIIDVNSHVTFAWFVKMIIARNKNENGIVFDKFERNIRKLSKELNFKSECFILPDIGKSSEKEGSIVLVVYAKNRTGLLSEILETLNKFDIDIMTINIEMEEDEKSFAMHIHTNIKTTKDNYFSQMESIREELKNLKARKEWPDFYFLIHSIETFNYIHKVDYESGL
jgi:predicted amino acid-binding ACT domain protein